MVNHRHHKRRRYTLSTDITDTEEQLFIADKEVEQVATDAFGRRLRAIQVDIGALGECREFLGNHRHLQLMSHLQLVIDRSLLRRLFFQIFHIRHERLLHGGKRVAQLTYLVFVGDGGQRRFEVAFSHLLSRVGQKTQRTDDLTDKGSARQTDDHQSDSSDNQNHERYHERRHHNGHFRHHNGHRPVGVFQWRIKHYAPLAIDRDRSTASLQLRHGPNHIAIFPICMRAYIIL